MSLAGYHINYGIISWIAVIGLPLNSLLNPILYTFSTSAFIDKMQSIRHGNPKTQKRDLAIDNQ